MTSTTTTAPAVIDFQEAAYVAPAGGPGRERQPNPFDKIVNDIAMKIDEKTKKPLAKSFTFEHPARNGDENQQKEIERLIAKYKRQLSDAGDVSTPRVTVKVHVAPVTNPVNGKASATKSTMTFWTVKRQVRPRTTATTTA